MWSEEAVERCGGWKQSVDPTLAREAGPGGDERALQNE